MNRRNALELASSYARRNARDLARELGRKPRRDELGIVVLHAASMYGLAGSASAKAEIRRSAKDGAERALAARLSG